VFLKRIDMLGFKSFADRTSIEFLDGITVLLGPNGCGKSNIVDAIKWTLGEQSVRNMRAEHMEDVIFSGSEKRQALSVAEVTITIVNDGGLLEIERPEIAIKRRIFRDGKNEYFLNGAAAKLKEIRGLFHDTGVGKSAYSVIEQGRINQILHSKPEDLRHLLEEAAGITKYRARETEAERKLAKTEENIERVKNVLHEVGKNYESLRKQSEKALEYRRLQKTVFCLDRDLKLGRLRELESGRERKEEEFQSCQEGCSKLTEKIDKIKAELASELDTVNKMKSRLIECQKLLYGMDLKKESQENLVRGVREQLDEAEGNRDSNKIRESSVLGAIHSLEELRGNREGELKSFGARYDEIKSGIGNLTRDIESTERRIRENLYEAKKAAGELAVQEQRGEELGEKLRAIADRIVSELDRRLKDSDYNKNARRDLEDSILRMIDELRIRVERSGRLLTKNPGNPAKTLELLERGVNDFLGLREPVEELSRLFNEYTRFEAYFLEEFLAPEGIITRKRKLDEEILTSVSHSRELRDRLNSLSEKETDLRGEVGRARGELEKLKVTQARVGAQMDAVRDSLIGLTREIDSEKMRLREIREQLGSEESRIQSLDAKLSDISSQREELENDKVVLRREITKLNEGIDSKNGGIASRENSLEELFVRKNKAQLRAEKIRLEIDYKEEEIKSLLSEFRSRYSKDLRSFPADTAKQSSSEIKEALQISKTRLKELGQVNLMAPEDFAEVSKRHDFLGDQLGDLGEAKDNLVVVTEKLRRESVDHFLQVHKEIKKHFHEVFRLLFGGGKAEIRLVDSEDPLNSDLEIYVQPPGKKLENFSLLSGGERSLCGIALMFATFLVKPSPFYVLDEIDAALDEASIQRLVNLLADSKKKSQFLLVTHNKRTISCASNLLGVTMQESGVSSIITLKLDGKKGKKNEELIAVGQ